MKILDKIEEQVSMLFTGKLNILLQDSKMLVGSIYLLEGKIVGCYYQKHKTYKSLLKLIYVDIEQGDQTLYVIEPEIVTNQNSLFSITFDQLQRDVNLGYDKFLKNKHLAPPMELKLIMNKKIMLGGSVINKEELSLLKIIKEGIRVSSLYKKSDMPNPDITSALIALREKKAIFIAE